MCTGRSKKYAWQPLWLAALYLKLNGIFKRHSIHSSKDPQAISWDLAKSGGWAVYMKY